jgi:hypothetical protein
VSVAIEEISAFPPVEDAFLSDCEVMALVAPSGSVEWQYLPRLDAPSVFAAILDRGAGSFRLGPAEASGSGGPALAAGDPGAGNHLGVRDGMGDRAGRADHMPSVGDENDSASVAGPDPPGRRPPHR